MLQMLIHSQLMEQFTRLDGLIAKSIKYLVDLTKILPLFFLHDASVLYLLDLVALIVHLGSVIYQEHIHELFLCESIRVMVGRLF